MPRRVLFAVIAAFVLSRTMIFILLLIGSHMAFLGKDYGNTIWRTESTIASNRVRPELVRMLMSGDAWWYRQIAVEGYRNDPARQNRSAFFPLYPLIVRETPFTGDFGLNGAIVSNIALLIGLFAVGAVGLRLGAADAEVERAIFYLAFFPTSYFFSLPMTESLFLALSAFAFLFAAQERWFASGIAGALAAATRVTGLILLPALLFLPSDKRARQLWLLLIPCGTAAFMIYLHFRVGDALAFVHAQAMWGRSGPAALLQSSGISGVVVSRPWNFVALNVAAAALMFTAGVAFIRRRQWAFATLTFGSLFLPLISGSVQSLARYALGVFPLFLWLGMRTENRLIDRSVLTVFTIVLGWLVAYFTLRVDFALA